MYAMGYWSKIGFIGQRVTGQILLLITGTVTWIIRSNGLEIELGLMPDVLLWINTTLIRWKTVKTVLRAVRQYAVRSEILRPRSTRNETDETLSGPYYYKLLISTALACNKGIT